MLKVSEALIEDIAQDAAIGQYDRQCPTSCPDENHSDAHDVSDGISIR